jgi:hypothetical protein
VPLSAPVRDLLAVTPRYSDLVFPGLRGAFNGFSKANVALDKCSGVTDWRLHDLRRTCATGLQRLGVRLEVTEQVSTMSRSAAPALWACINGMILPMRSAQPWRLGAPTSWRLWRAARPRITWCNCRGAAKKDRPGEAVTRLPGLIDQRGVSTPMTDSTNSVRHKALQAGNADWLLGRDVPARPVDMQARWLSLSDAHRLAVRILKNDERWLLPVRKIEQSYRSDKSTLGLLRLRDGRDPFKLATVDVARYALEWALESGTIRGVGFHEDKGQRLPIVDEAWATRRIDYDASALVPHNCVAGVMVRFDQHSKSFPPITGVVVSRDDVIGAFNRKIPRKADGADVGPDEAHGTRPLQRPSNRNSPARQSAKRALKEIYGGKIPSQDEERNAVLCRKVGAKIKEYGLPEISDETILRAAGRHK